MGYQRKRAGFPALSTNHLFTFSFCRFRSCLCCKNILDRFFENRIWPCPNDFDAIEGIVPKVLHTAVHPIQYGSSTVKVKAFQFQYWKAILQGFPEK